MPIVAMTDICKDYYQGKEPVRVLQGKGKIKTLQHADPGKNGNVWSMTRYSVHY